MQRYKANSRSQHLKVSPAIVLFANLPLSRVLGGFFARYNLECVAVKNISIGITKIKLCLIIILILETFKLRGRVSKPPSLEPSLTNIAVVIHTDPPLTNAQLVQLAQHLTVVVFLFIKWSTETVVNIPGPFLSICVFIAR